MKISLPSILSQEIEDLAKSKNESFQSIITRILKNGIIAHKNSDELSHLIIVNPKGQKKCNIGN